MSAWLISTAPAFAAAPDGATIFNERCVACHQADGGGTPGMAPALAGTLKLYLASPEGHAFLSQIVVSGMGGKIESQGHTIIGLMPSFAGELDDASIAAVVDYALARFNGAPGDPITRQDVTMARARHPTPTATRKLREAIKAAAK